MKLSEAHKDVYDEFKKGCFGIKRTKMDFSRLPIDLTLEQTVNADEASQKTGISYFTNSISARQRWADSHFIRMEVLSEVLNKLGMTTKEDVSQDLKPNRIMKNTRDLEKIVRSIQENMNPFSEEVNKYLLFNIGTGKSSKQETAEFLLNVKKIGQKAREGFIIQSVKDPKCFEERILRHKILNFANEGAPYSLRGSNNKLMAVEMVLNLFGSILFLAVQIKIDMVEVLSFPLTPAPLSLSHADGTMLKTQKSKLVRNQTMWMLSSLTRCFFFICGKIYQQPLVPLQGFC